LFSTAQNAELNQLRSLFPQADKEAQICNKLLLLSSQLGEMPLAKAYYATTKMISSQHEKNPIKKWSNFSQGKEQLEELIKIYPDNIEMRFLRYCIQLKAPKFLAYNQNLQEDYALINHALIDSNLKTTSYIKPIFNKINNNGTGNISR
jgi:hypothetical protein